MTEVISNVTNKEVCPICGAPPIRSFYDDGNTKHIACKYCGYFMLTYHEGRILGKPDDYNINKLAPYLFYSTIENKSKNKEIYYYLPFRNSIDNLKERYPNIEIQTLKIEDIEAWYPKNFSEKIDKIMLALANISKFDGDTISLSREEAMSLLFIERFDQEGKFLKTSIEPQKNLIFDYMAEQGLIKKVIERTIHNTRQRIFEFVILPKGLARIDELQKYQTNNKQAFVAMDFGEELNGVRDAILRTIEKAGYSPRIMSQIEHNNQIVPEMLYEIRQCQFVIAEFSKCNNGAYYEAGYAAGLGKEVIHVCETSTFGKEGHFDIKQKNSVLWKKDETAEHEDDKYKDLEKKLYERIKATIN